MLRPEGTHYALVITKPEVKRATAQKAEAVSVLHAATCGT